MRLFVAIFPPPEVREALLHGARSLVPGGSVRWSRPANVHLTLKFLGEVPEDAAEGVRRTLGALGERHRPFRVEPSVLGAFPSARRARIVWAGIEAGSGELRTLANDLEGSLEPLGFPCEARPYAPHITLGRVRGRPVALKEAGAALGVSGFEARGIELVRSVLGESGAVYSTLAAYPFSKDGD